MESLGEEVEYHRGCAKAEGQSSFTVIGAVPVEAEKPLIRYCHGDVPKRLLDVSLDNDGVPAGGGNVVNDLIKGDIDYGPEFLWNEGVDRGVVWEG